MEQADEYFMGKALALAARGRGRTSPNPMVGAVVVKDGHIIGEGYHARAGTPHAEIHALRQAGVQSRGSTLYVTLEPCCHFGRTPPCTTAIIAAGVQKVVAATRDPNPLVSGHGLQVLRESGLTVCDGVLAREATKLNEVFFKWITTGLPFVVLKTAMTLDGKIATVAGQSQWITGPAARQRVHVLRDTYDAVMVGIGTVLADNPRLTVRLAAAGRNPVRIIVDSEARTPPTAHVIADGAAPTIIAVGSAAPTSRVNVLAKAGARIMSIPSTAQGIDIKELFIRLGQEKITSVLVEGGGTLAASVLAAGVVDKVYYFIAPKIIGGVAAPGPVGGAGIVALARAYQLYDTAVELLDADVLVSGYIRKEMT